MISKHTIMAFLVFSAVVLVCLLFAELVCPPSQAGAATSSRAGFFVVSTAARSADEDLLWIANVRTQQLIVCGRNRSGGIIILGGLNLARVFGD